MSEIALLVAALGLFWTAANLAAWWMTVRSVRHMSPREQRPWNWRLLVGPFAYYPWLARWEAARERKPQTPSLLVLDDSWPPRRVGDRRG